jgi:hypothetical protein
VSGNLRYSEDELRDQWAFIDSLVETQAAALRTGTPDPEEDDAPPAAAPGPDPGLLHELEVLRARVAALEAERRELRERLRLAELPHRPAAVAAAAPRPAPSRVREWWRRISR